MCWRSEGQLMAPPPPRVPCKQGVCRAESPVRVIFFSEAASSRRSARSLEGEAGAEPTHRTKESSGAPTSCRCGNFGCRTPASDVAGRGRYPVAGDDDPERNDVHLDAHRSQGDPRNVVRRRARCVGLAAEVAGDQPGGAVPRDDRRVGDRAHERVREGVHPDRSGGRPLRRRLPLREPARIGRGSARDADQGGLHAQPEPDADLDPQQVP